MFLFSHAALEDGYETRPTYFVDCRPRKITCPLGTVLYALLMHPLVYPITSACCRYQFYSILFFYLISAVYISICLSVRLSVGPSLCLSGRQVNIIYRYDWCRTLALSITHTLTMSTLGEHCLDMITLTVSSHMTVIT